MTVPAAEERKLSLRERLAIIGSIALVVLALGVFVPRAWEHHRRSSEIAGAKTGLSGIFTAEKAFFGEYMTYTTDLVSLNWFPNGEPRFVYGFCNRFPLTLYGIPTHRPDRNVTTHPDVIGSPYARYSPAAHTVGDPCLALRGLGLDDRFVATGQRFRAFAVGNLDADPDLEIWSHDEEKNLTRIAMD